MCGSRDLSTPHEKLPFWFRILLFLSGILPGLALLVLSLIYIGYFLERLILSPSALLVPMLLGLALGVAWFLWMHVPFLLIRILRRGRRGT